MSDGISHHAIGRRWLAVIGVAAMAMSLNACEPSNNTAPAATSPATAAPQNPGNTVPQPDVTAASQTTADTSGAQVSNATNSPTNLSSFLEVVQKAGYTFVDSRGNNSPQWSDTSRWTLDPLSSSITTSSGSGATGEANEYGYFQSEPTGLLAGWTWVVCNSENLEVVYQGHSGSGTASAGGIGDGWYVGDVNASNSLNLADMSPNESLLSCGS